MSVPADEYKFYACLAEDCEVISKSVRKRVIHIDEAHEGQVLCPDENCGIFLKSSSVYQHINVAHGTNLHKESCKHCGKSISKQSISDHRKRCKNRGKEVFHCRFGNCRSSFAVEKDLFKHLNVVHRSLIKCTEENCKSMLKPHNLAQHIKSVHNKVKEICQNCKKQIMYHNLKAHQERCTADGEKKFSCTLEGCEAKFATSVNRSHHLRTVHKATVKCPRDNCHASFRPRNLNQHIKQVHDKVKRKCQFCHQNFMFNYLSRHEKKCEQK